ncbi:IFRD domain-containing protein [Drechmeria coniospora]|uniref:IFRD domain-containing protein n=1 Tax=Drechmeria coniospora TaxID=98403 RepID=A0A151GV53_DRECN|nr:IFRD domain-containing protein [Drechmeria coniospora]KYK60979.1 IFRD domain-containing protein [Drechmeria coniospora]
MNHARVKALKGAGKTVSRKAQKSGRASGALTPQGASPMPSLLTSPARSAVPSRVASDASDDEDDGDFELDDMTSSIHSAGSGTDAAADVAGSFDVKALIEGLEDKKHNNADVREQYLQTYIKVMRTRYAPETHQWLDPSVATLAEIFLKNSNRGATATERLLSLQSYCLTVGTVEDVDVVEAGSRILKQILTDEDDEECRVFAVYALCMTVLYGGGGEEAAIDLMEYLVEIVQTDGDSIEAHDNATVVSAALQGWAFVASHVEDYSDYADAAMDAFVDQLDSSDVDVQSNAAQCIALIYESSRNHEHETGKPFQLAYDPRRLSGRIGELAKLSAKSVSKKSRRDLRESLTSVVTSLERAVGPYYSTALYIPEKDTFVPPSLRTDDGRAEYGYRCKLRLGNVVATIDTWSLFSRVNMLKTFFRAGLQRHVFVNPVVMECLEDADWGESHATDEAERKQKLSAKSRKR